MMITEAPATITRADLDWVCITHRALANNPTNHALWAQAVITLLRLTQAFDALAVDASHASHAQYLLNRIVQFALMPGDAPTLSGAPVALVTEHMKDHLMHLAARGYDVQARV
jgi:hypothetical protein